jgi:hypothetical protein
MESPEQSSEYRVESTAQAVAFTNVPRWQILLACARDEQSLSQLRTRFRMSLSKLHYHAGKLVELGLLRVSRTEPRGGRAIRYYRAIAESFVVSQELLPGTPGDRWEKELRESLRALAIRRDFYLVYGLGPEGKPRVLLRDESDDARRSDAIEVWKVVRLTPAQRLALASEMQALLARYPDSAQDGEPVLIHCAFAPLPARN